METRSIEDFPFPIYQRVTEVLSPFSGMSCIPKDILESACVRGSAVHEIIECIQAGLPWTVDDNLKGYIDSYSEWAKNKQFIKTPSRFFDDELMITGECDCLYLKDGGLILVDFKTSAKEGKTWKYQGAAYAHLAKRDGYVITGIEFVQLSKEGAPARSYRYADTGFQGFLRLLSVYREFFESQKTAFDMGDI